MNAIREPSGDHDGSVGVAPVWVSWRASPLRDSAIQIVGGAKNGSLAS